MTLFFFLFQNDPLPEIMKSRTKAQLIDEVKSIQNEINNLKLHLNNQNIESIKLKSSKARIESLIEHTSDAVFCYEFNPPISIKKPIHEQVKLML
jgi:hypothetical protein